MLDERRREGKPRVPEDVRGESDQLQQRLGAERPARARDGRRRDEKEHSVIGAIIGKAALLAVRRDTGHRAHHGIRRLNASSAQALFIPRS
jgi:hypothetical protein